MHFTCECMKQSKKWRGSEARQRASRGDHQIIDVKVKKKKISPPFFAALQGLTFASSSSPTLFCRTMSLHPRNADLCLIFVQIVRATVFLQRSMRWTGQGCVVYRPTCNKHTDMRRCDRHVNQNIRRDVKMAHCTQTIKRREYFREKSLCHVHNIE